MRERRGKEKWDTILETFESNFVIIKSEGYFSNWLNIDIKFPYINSLIHTNVPTQKKKEKKLRRREINGED